MTKSIVTFSSRARGKQRPGSEADRSAELVNNTQNTLTDSFIEIVRETDEEVAKLLTQIRDIQSLPTRQDRDIEHKKLSEELDQAAKKSGNQNLRIKVMEAYAKYQDIARRSRKITNAEIFAEKAADSADAFAYVLEKAHAEGVPPETLGELFRKNAVTKVSLTAHPTNSATTEYTNIGLFLDEAIDAGNPDFIDVALRKIRDTSITGPKKSQALEMQETIDILDKIYSAVPKVRAQLEKALSKYPKYKEEIDTTKPLVEPCVWATGDGDGNDNATAQSLNDGINLLRRRIKALYIRDLSNLENKLGRIKSKQSIAGDKDNIEKARQHIQTIRKKLLENQYAKPDDFLYDLKSLSSLYNAKEIEDLKQRVRTFGFHYAKIDIRHNSDDIMLTLATAAVLAGLIPNKEALLGQTDEAQLAIVNKWLGTDKEAQEARASLRAAGLDPAQITQETKAARKLVAVASHVGAAVAVAVHDDKKAKENAKAANIFNRLKLIGQNPSMSDKFIIAEAKSATHSLSALLLLKITRPEGVDVDMDVVTLSESIDDLEKLPGIAETELNNTASAAHIEKRGRLIKMVAFSDTSRRKGAGCRKWQEAAIGKTCELVDRVSNGKISAEIFMGGGCSFQRGGGNVFEGPHNVGRYARRFGANCIGVVSFTSQGLQSIILFSPASSAAHSIEALTSHSLYSAAQTQFICVDLQTGEKIRIIKPRTAPRDLNEAAQLAIFDGVCSRATAAYTSYVGDPDDVNNQGTPAINELFKNGPWLSVMFGNLSSRPGKRGSSETGNTVASLKGDPNWLDNRAITVERISGHSGTHFLTYLGLVEGLSSLSTQQAHNMFRASKSCRDLMRNVATSLHMTDFDKSWRMMVGRERPTLEEREELLSEYRRKTKANEPIKPEETLAFIEDYAHQTAGLIYKCITGNEPARDINLKTTLQNVWSDLAEQLEMRSKIGEFGSLEEAKLVNQLNNNPHMPVTPELITILKLSYSAEDIATNAPEGAMQLTATSKDKEREEMENWVSRKTLKEENPPVRARL